MTRNKSAGRLWKYLPWINLKEFPLDRTKIFLVTLLRFLFENIARSLVTNNAVAYHCTLFSCTYPLKKRIRLYLKPYRFDCKSSDASSTETITASCS